MAQIIWTEPALLELEGIAEFIALDKFEAAQALVRAVFDHVELLKTQPKSGRKPPELPQDSIYREVVIGPCRIFYRLEKNKIIILHVMRGERTLRKFLLEDRTKTSD